MGNRPWRTGYQAGTLRRRLVREANEVVLMHEDGRLRPDVAERVHKHLAKAVKILEAEA
jgi:hypothetical protein